MKPTPFLRSTRGATPACELFGDPIFENWAYKLIRMQVVLLKQSAASAPEMVQGNRSLSPIGQANHKVKLVHCRSLRSNPLSLHREAVHWKPVHWEPVSGRQLSTLLCEWAYQALPSRKATYLFRLGTYLFDVIMGASTP